MNIREHQLGQGLNLWTAACEMLQQDATYILDPSFPRGDDQAADRATIQLLCTAPI